jgi:peroxin-19
LKAGPTNHCGKFRDSRCKQYQGLKDLISVYDNEPDNSDKLMDLMKEVQEYGLPPSDIVSSIAPDLKLDEDGVPQLNPLQDCSIM